MVVGDKFCLKNLYFKLMRKMCLKQLVFTYRVCGPFTKSKEKIENFKETGDSRHICQKELDKACFQFHMALMILTIYIEEQFLIKYFVIKHLILPKMKDMMDINVDLFQ